MSVDNVNDIEPRVQYVATAGQTAFDYPFPIFADADLVVDVDGVTQALSTDYTVTGEGDDAGGTVTLLSALAGDEIVTIYRDIPIERTTDFAQNGPLAAASFNDEFDKLTMISQQLESAINRALRFPPTVDLVAADIELSPVANWLGKFLYFNASTGAPEPATTVTTSALTRSTIGETLFPLSDAETSAGLTSADINEYWPYFDVRRYKVVGDGVTDDTQALINAGSANLSCYIDPSLTCLVSGSLAAGMQSYQRWWGGGKIKVGNSFNFNVFDLSGKTDVTIDGLRGESGTLSVSYSTATARFVAAKSLSHRCRVLNCTVTGFQSAVQFNNSTHCKAIGNTILSSIGWGINVQTDADYAEVRGNNIVTVTNEHGIYASGSSGNAIKGVRIVGNVVTGATIDGIKTTYCDDPLIEGNVSISNGGQGVYITVGTNRADVNSNLAETNGENGVLVFDSTTTSDGNRVHHNTIRKNDKNGVSVSSSGAGAVSHTTVEANDIDDNDQEATGTQYGIVTSGATTTTDTIIRNNRISNETIGVRVGSGLDTVIDQDAVYFENCGTNISDAGTTSILPNGSFTGSLTGCTTVPTGTVEYSRRGDLVVLEIPAISATSNTTAATITGMPTVIKPAAAQTVVGITQDNGTTAFGKIIVETNGTLTLHVAQSATFTGSGTKGVGACTVAYRLS